MIDRGNTDTTVQGGRIKGALLGLACGDALGAPAEFKSQGQVKAQFGELRDMVGGGLWKPGEWTDDTAMALCLAEGILANPSDPVEAAGERFLQWSKGAKDVGNTISATLAGYQNGSGTPGWFEAARTNPRVSFGRASSNGSLMRTLPVALAYPQQQEMLRQSARLSAMTHWDAQAETCCAVYCLWVRELLQGGEMEASWQHALQIAKELAGQDKVSPDTVGMEPLPDGFWERLQSVGDKQYSDLQPSGYAGYVVECLEAAVWCCLKSPSLEEALVAAVNLAGEADTIAAVAGGAAGAFWGYEALPARWLEKLHERERLESVAGRLAMLCWHQEIYDTRRLRTRPFSHDWIDDRILAGRNPLSAWDIALLRDLGITHVLDLRQPHEWEEGRDGEAPIGKEAIEAIDQMNLRRLHLEVPDLGAPTSKALDTACRFIEEAIQDHNGKVYVHCRAGMERTAAILVGFHARREGISYDEALQQLVEKRPIFNPLPGQERAVRHWLSQ